eukprot:m.21104 g.21104  ORF g.21104 m.21104 type:complete len:75 (+) comp32497_c0_seq2:232-456(+)
MCVAAASACAVAQGASRHIVRAGISRQTMPHPAALTCRAWATASALLCSAFCALTLPIPHVRYPGTPARKISRN